MPQNKSNLSFTATNLNEKASVKSQNETEIEESELADNDDEDEEDSSDEDDDDDDDDDFENNEMLSNTDNGEYKSDDLDKIKQAAQSKKESKYLIENDEELYKSIVNTEKWKTSLLTNKKVSKKEHLKNVKINLGDDKATSTSIDEEDEFDENNNNTFELDPEKLRLADEGLNGLNNDDSKVPNKKENPVMVKSVDEMAKLLVNNIMNQALNDNTGDLTHLEKNFRYNIDAKNNSKNSHHSQAESVACLTEFNLNKSNSKLSYYKEFQSECDLTNKKNESNSTDEKMFKLEFVDEPDECVFFFIIEYLLRN